MWRRTKECTDFTREDSRQICQHTLGLIRELAASEEAAQIETELAGVQKRLGEFAGVVTDADPQVQTLASVMDLPPDKVKLALVLLLATLVEVASAFGITVVSLATSRETMLRIEARAAKAMTSSRPISSRSMAGEDVSERSGRERILTIKTGDGGASAMQSVSPAGQQGGIVNGAQSEAGPTAVKRAPAFAEQVSSVGSEATRSEAKQVTGNWVTPKNSW